MVFRRKHRSRLPGVLHRLHGGTEAHTGASTPLEEVDRDVLRHFAELVRDGGFDEDGGEECA